MGVATNVSEPATMGLAYGPLVPVVVTGGGVAAEPAPGVEGAGAVTEGRDALESVLLSVLGAEALALSAASF